MAGIMEEGECIWKITWELVGPESTLYRPKTITSCANDHPNVESKAESFKDIKNGICPNCKRKIVREY